MITKGVFGKEFDQLIQAAQSQRGTIITSIDTTDPNARESFGQLRRNDRGYEFVRLLLEQKKRGGRK